MLRFFFFRNRYIAINYRENTENCISIEKVSSLKMSIMKNKGSEIICPIEYTFDLLSGKWKLPILKALLKMSPKRFNTLEREITGISPKMLSENLRELETAGLVSKEIFAIVPPKVEYGLTELGKTIQPMMREIEKWGLMHMKTRPWTDNKIIHEKNNDDW
jgi:DNA-binding HxlR family transcriptional regulator